MNEQSWLDAILTVAWPEDSGAARSLVMTILAMFVLAMYWTFVHLARIGREHAALQRVAVALRTWRKQALPQGEEANASQPERFPRLTLEELEQKLAEVRKQAGADSHVAKLLSAIHMLRIHRMKVNLATLQQVVERDEATRRGVNLPGYVANFAVMVGILGTFWGLGNMLTSIGSALPSAGAPASMDSWAQSVEQIRHVLSGMRTAFSASLVGMACSIGSGLGAAVLSARQQRLLQALEAFAANELLPATVPTLEDDSILEQVSGQLEAAFSKIDDIAIQNRQSMTELSAAQLVFQSIISEVRSITHGEASRDLQGVLEAVVGSNAAIQRLVSELPGVVSAHQQRASAPRVAEPWPAAHAPLSHLTMASLSSSPPRGALPSRTLLLVVGGVAVLVVLILLMRLT